MEIQRERTGAFSGGESMTLLILRAIELDRMKINNLGRA